MYNNLHAHRANTPRIEEGVAFLRRRGAVGRYIGNRQSGNEAYGFGPAKSRTGMSIQPLPIQMDSQMNRYAPA